MYLLIDTPVSGLGDTIQSVLEKVCEVFVNENEDGSFSVTYKVKHCFMSKSTFSYSDEYTKEEVYKDFYKTHVRPLLKENGYVLFQEIS